MSSSVSDLSARRALVEGRELALDRIACTGHGVCAALVDRISLDEFGYPIIEPGPVEKSAGGAAIRLCPAGALRWKRTK